MLYVLVYVYQKKIKDLNFKPLFFAAKHKQDILFAQDILYAPTVRVGCDGALESEFF
jgi:hypothetical protein